MFDIVIFKGIETKEVIGLNKKQVIEILGNPINIHPQWLRGDAFEYSEYHAFFDEDGLCEAIEFFEEIEVGLNGTKLTGMSKKEALLELAKKHPFYDDGNTIYFLDISLGLSCPDGIVNEVCIGKKGYYDIFKGRERFLPQDRTLWEDEHYVYSAELQADGYIKVKRKK